MRSVRTVGLSVALVSLFGASGTPCGVASIRAGRDFTGYVLSVVGPDAIDGCTSGATIAFRVDGTSAARARPVTNTPPGEDNTLDLRVG